MKRWAVGTIAILVFAVGAEALASWQDSKIDPLQGGYIVYGGDLGDWTAPKQGDAKVNIEISGALGKQMFDLMGARAEKKGACGEEGETARVAGDIACIRENTGATRCHVGLDLAKGKSINGLLC
jgi:hypothetical protein